MPFENHLQALNFASKVLCCSSRAKSALGSTVETTSLSDASKSMEYVVGSPTPPHHEEKAAVVVSGPQSLKIQSLCSYPMTSHTVFQLSNYVWGGDLDYFGELARP